MFLALLLGRWQGGAVTAAWEQLAQALPWRAAQVRWDGRVDAQEGSTWTVAGRQVQVRDATLRAEVGAWVRVKAVVRDDGALVATAVVPLAGMPLHAASSSAASVPASPVAAARWPVEFEGRITGLPAGDKVGSWSVAGVQVLVDADTRIHGDPRPGAYAELRGVQDDRGALRASEIWVEDEGAETVLVGRLGALAATAAQPGWPVELLDERDQPVALKIVMDKATFVDESQGRAEQAAWVEIRAVPLPDGSWLARYIRVLRR